jgi:hypothetical protein
MNEDGAIFAGVSRLFGHKMRVTQNKDKPQHGL